MAAVQADLNKRTEAERITIQEYSHLETIQALEEEVQTITARLELIAESNPGALKSYEKREEDMAKTREKIETHTADLEIRRGEIVDIRQQWEPQLDTLVKKISHAFAHNFEQIGCAGEVTVHKDEEDFDKWSIQISVRFR